MVSTIYVSLGPLGSRYGTGTCGHISLYGEPRSLLSDLLNGQDYLSSLVSPCQMLEVINLLTLRDVVTGNLDESM